MNKVEDRVVQYPNRYQLKNVSTGTILGTFDLVAVPGSIQNEGTLINANLFASIAQDISTSKSSAIATANSNTNTVVNSAKQELSLAIQQKEDKSKLGALAYKNSLTKEDVGLGNVSNTPNGEMNVNHAKTADYATEAGHAINANLANEAVEAEHASNAEKADYATNAGSASNATYATSAGSASNSSKVNNISLSISNGKVTFKNSSNTEVPVSQASKATVADKLSNESLSLVKIIDVPEEKIAVNYFSDASGKNIRFGFLKSYFNELSLNDGLVYFRANLVYTQSSTTYNIAIFLNANVSSGQINSIQIMNARVSSNGRIFNLIITNKTMIEFTSNGTCVGFQIRPSSDSGELSGTFSKGSYWQIIQFAKP